MLTWGLAQLAGALVVLLQPALPHAGVFLLSLPFFLAALVRPPWRLFAAAWLGAALASWQADRVLEDRLDPSLEAEIVVVTGTIHGLVEREGRRQRFLFHPEVAADADGNPVTLPTRIRLNVYENLELASGERWRWRIKVRRPRGLANPGGFDYERWLFAQRIGAMGYVYRPFEPPAAERVDASTGEFRARVANRVAERTNGEAAGLIRGLATGDRTAITNTQWDLLRRTGTAHLMAISGLHIGLVASLAVMVGVFLRRRWLPGSPLSWPYVLAAATALAYGALAGFTLPVRRALIGAAVLLLALGWRRQLTPGHAFGLALSAVLWLDPLAPLDVGFWLSFGAVAAILFLLAGRRPAGSRSWRAVRVQLGLFLLLAPLLLAGFGKVPLVSPIANAVAIPLFGFLVVPGVLLAVALLPLGQAADPLLAVLDQLLGYLQAMLAWLAGLDPGLVSRELPLLVLCAVALAAALFCAPRAVPGRAIALWLLLPAFGFNQPARENAELAMHVLDVGQGLAVVIETPRHTLVYDTGPGFGDSDAGEMVLIPFLESRGRKPEAVVISHGHNDHAGGLATLQSRYPGLRSMGRMNGPAAVEDCAEQAWHWDNVSFRMLYPEPGDEGSPNDISCVLLVEAGDRRLLLTGDIEARAEARLLSRRREDVQADVVILPHHGSRTSSTPAFVSAVGATVAIAGAGFGNRWGFPRPDVVARWERAGTEVLATGDHGAISVVFSRDDIEVRRFRDGRRIWRDAAAAVR